MKHLRSLLFGFLWVCATASLCFAQGDGPAEPPVPTPTMFDKAWETLLPVFEWAAATFVGKTIRDSTWGFAYIEVFHLFGLTILLGSALVVGLRVAGIILRTQPVDYVWKQIRPIALGGFILATGSGLLLFSAEAIKCFQSPPFQYKMVFFFAGVIFHFAIFRRILRSKTGVSILGRAAAIVSILIWFGVGIFGRGIGFF